MLTVKLLIADLFVDADAQTTVESSPPVQSPEFNFSPRDQSEPIDEPVVGVLAVNVSFLCKYLLYH